MEAFVSQYEAFRDRIGVYGIFAALKPVGVSQSPTAGTEKHRGLTVPLSV
jgi:hypothetical protein